MGKQGPCCHCGVTSTPLWRNGPPEKPVLCNACGSRWRTKGTLVNYAPLHARSEHDNLEDNRFWKSKSSPLKNKESKIHKRKFNIKVSAAESFLPNFNYGLNYRGYDENISNRSSSGSAISNPESYVQCADASELTGPSQRVAWDSTVPSRKRTCVNRPKPSPVEKLTKDLYTIWHEQQSSCSSEFSEEDLLLETDKPMVSVEIGHGSVLIRHPKSITQEEESVASSLTFTSKHDTVNSRQLNFHSHVACNGVDSSSEGIEKIKNYHDWELQQEETGSDKDPLGKLQILTHQTSPLCNTNLQEIVNINNFMDHLTNDEQQLLLKFLPEEDIGDNKDTSNSLDRDLISMSCLKSMFESPQFKADLLFFQTLLEDGVFNEAKTEDVKILKKLILCDLAKRNWVEQFKIFKDSRSQNRIGESKLVGILDESETDQSVQTQKSRDVLPRQKHSGQEAVSKSPRDHVNMNDAFLSSNHLFPSHNNNGLSMNDDPNFLSESSDNDLLLDIPSNGSFPQAELLLPTSSVML